MEQIDDYYNTIIELTRKAAKVVKEKLHEVKQDVQRKSHATDFVTEIDKYVEEMLIGNLKDKYPTHRFIGEEETATGVKVKFTDDPTWIIDPVDGTLNFVHGYPNVCISVGLTINKELQIGIIQVPAYGWEFAAKKDHGAFLNSKPIHVSSSKRLSDSLITLEMPSTFGNLEKVQEVKNNLNVFLGRVHGLRAAGSAAFNLAMVALGGSDAYFEIGIHAWDYAGGALIVREAGGVVIDPSGGELDLMARRVLAAATPELAEEISSLMIQIHPTRDDA